MYSKGKLWKRSHVVLNGPIVHTTPIGNTLETPELGTHLYNGQNFGSQWCLLLRGSTLIVHVAEATSSTDIINASSCTGQINNYRLGLLMNGLTIFQGRCHRSKPYTTLYRMVCINIDSDVVSFYPWAVIDQPHYEPWKMKLKILLLSFPTTLPNDTQVYLDWEGEREV